VALASQKQLLTENSTRTIGPKRLRPGHRKLVKHYEDLRHVRELTFSCFQRWPLLTNDTWQEMLSRSIDSAGQRHDWRLMAFVYMPEHVHCLWFADMLDRKVRAAPTEGLIHTHPLAGDGPAPSLLAA